MRIIAGKYRGRNLKSPLALETRPTSDRLRETLFNVIGPRLEGARFLDLCAGSGAVGIEALSRGAAYVTFVDRSRKMGQLIDANLELCGVGNGVAAPDPSVRPAPGRTHRRAAPIASEAEVVITDAAEFLRRRASRKAQAWTLVFFDPPYAEDYLPVLRLFGGEANQLLEADGLLVVEHHHKNHLPEIVGSLSRRRVLKQGESALSFYEKDE